MRVYGSAPVGVCTHHVHACVRHPTHMGVHVLRCTGIFYWNRNCFVFTVRKRLISQLILPIMDFGDIVYQTAAKTTLRPLSTIYNRLHRFVLDCPFTTHHCSMYGNLNWPSPTLRRQQHWSQFIFKCIYFNYPQYLKQFLIPYTCSHHLRHSIQVYFVVPKV